MGDGFYRKEVGLVVLGFVRLCILKVMDEVVFLFMVNDRKINWWYWNVM